MIRAAFGTARRVEAALALTTLLISARAHGEARAASSEESLALSGAPAGRGISVQVESRPTGFHVEGRCRIAASRDVAWSVLTDYDGITRFVSSMRHSRIVERGAAHVLVDQTAEGRMLFFSRSLHVLLRVEEEAPTRIRFVDVLTQDFLVYEGEWTIEGHGSEIDIDYEVTARPNFSAPGFLARRSFGKTVRQLLSQVGAEIARRAAANDRAVVGVSGRETRTESDGHPVSASSRVTP